MLSFEMRQAIGRLETEEECREAFEAIRTKWKTIRNLSAAKTLSKLQVGSVVEVKVRGRLREVTVEAIHRTTIVGTIDEVKYRIPVSAVIRILKAAGEAP
ncbi:MAG: hypothetical protein ACQCN4_02550 [Candidatus Bathyarchaeia archaeon]|jgi:hypothetical protein